MPELTLSFLVSFSPEQLGRVMMSEIVSPQYDEKRMERLAELSNVDAENEKGQRGVMLAVMAGNASALRVLVLKNANLDRPDYAGKTLESYVRESGNTTIARALSDARDELARRGGGMDRRPCWP
jgi:hypothetical protein